MALPLSLFFWIASIVSAPPPSSRVWYDDLLVDGKRYYLDPVHDTMPLDQFATPAIRMLRDGKIAGDPYDTYCELRNFHAEWEISRNRLYLTKIKRCRPDTGKVDLQKIFGSAYRDGRVPVRWFTGQLIALDTLEGIGISQLEIHVRNGRCVSKKLHDNSKTRYADVESQDIQRLVFDSTRWAKMPHLGPYDEVGVLLEVFTDTTGRIEQVKVVRQVGSCLSAVVKRRGNYAPEKIYEGLEPDPAWNDEACRLFMLLPEWHIQYDLGKQVPTRGFIGFHGKEYYREQGWLR